jgi:hypothetical protein
MKQLRLLVSLIAMSYNDNKFHDFSHAAHVTVSLNHWEHEIALFFLEDEWGQFLTELNFLLFIRCRP